MYSFPKIAALAATHCYHGDLALTRYFLPVICAAVDFVLASVYMRYREANIGLLC